MTKLTCSGYWECPFCKSQRNDVKLIPRRLQSAWTGVWLFSRRSERLPHFGFTDTDSIPNKHSFLHGNSPRPQFTREFTVSISYDNLKLYRSLLGELASGLSLVFITGSRYDAPGLPLVKRLGWKSIDELISSESNIMVFKSLHGLAPQYMSNLFTKTSQLTSRNLRNSATDLRVPKKKSANGQKCFSFRGAKSWNGLSAEHKNASTIYKFKRVDNQ